MQLASLIVLDGEMRSTLGIVRSLGRKGIPVAVGSNNPFGRSNFSKHVKSHFSDPSQNPEAAHYAIIKEIEKKRPDILMPAFDYGWSIVYSHYYQYERLTRVVPNPGRELFEGLLDNDGDY